MVFHFLAGLLSLLTSSLVYIIGVMIFSTNLTMATTFILALIVLSIIVWFLRLIFSPKGKGVLHSMQGMHVKGLSLRKVMTRFKENMEREIISGSVARVFAFGTILFLFTNNIFIVYASLAVGLGSGLILMITHRHQFVDVFSGALLGCAVGFLSWKFTPLLMKFFGF